MTLSTMAAALALAAANPTIPALCDQLAAFTGAPFDSTVEPKGRRWVEFHWRGTWLSESGWGVGCLHSPDAASIKLCDWLIQHMSYEFGVRRTMSMLECYGYALPRDASWGDWKADISILGDDLRWIKLEVDFATLKGEPGAFRFSSFDTDLDDALVEMPPIQPMPPLESKAQ
jgi:hypothetical protein